MDETLHALHVWDIISQVLGWQIIDLPTGYWPQKVVVGVDGLDATLQPLREASLRHKIEQNMFKTKRRLRCVRHARFSNV